MRTVRLRPEFRQPPAYWKTYLRRAYTALAEAQRLRRPLTSGERRDFRQYVQRYLRKCGWIGTAREMAEVYHAMREEREEERQRVEAARAAAAKRHARVK